MHHKIISFRHPQIAIINNADRDYPTDYQSLKALVPLDADFHVFEAQDNNLPSSKFDFHILTGSPSNVTSPQPWMEGLFRFIRFLVESNQPFLAICFALQATAKALGGEVGWGEEFGVIDVYPVDRSQPFQALSSHKQKIVRMPSTGASILAINKECVQMVQFGRNGLGTQFHPEATPKRWRQLVDASDEGLDYWSHQTLKRNRVIRCEIRQFENSENTALSRVREFISAKITQ